MDALSDEMYTEAANVLRDAAEIIEARGLYRPEVAPDGHLVTVMEAIDLATFGDIDEDRNPYSNPLWIAAVSRVSNYLFDRAPLEPFCDRENCKCDMPHEYASLMLALWGQDTATLADTVALALRMAAQS